MTEELIRKELPIQCVYQRGYAVTATVPVHLAVMDLSYEVRTDISLIANAKDVVKPWYDGDMEYYLDVLREDGTELPWLRNYEKFRDEWKLSGEPDENGFLSLLWGENGSVHKISFNPVSVILNNEWEEPGRFYTPESFTKGRLIEIVYRDLKDPETVVMNPDKLRKYGKETDFARIDEEKGRAEVVANAFTSDYHDSMAKALLLRDFSVFYLNNLFSIARRTIH